MSMLSSALSPSACETDITGLVACTHGAGIGPAQRADGLDNNYGDDGDKCVLFHCSNLPQDFFGKKGVMDYRNHRRLRGQGEYLRHRGRQGAAHGVHVLPVSTDDPRGVLRAYVGEGEFTRDRWRLRRLRRGEDR